MSKILEKKRKFQRETQIKSNLLEAVIAIKNTKNLFIFSSFWTKGKQLVGIVWSFVLFLLICFFSFSLSCLTFAFLSPGFFLSLYLLSFLLIFLRQFFWTCLCFLIDFGGFNFWIFPLVSGKIYMFCFYFPLICWRKEERSKVVPRIVVENISSYWVYEKLFFFFSNFKEVASK